MDLKSINMFCFFFNNRVMMLTFKKYTYIIPSGGTESYVKVSRTLRVTNGLTPWATVSSVPPTIQYRRKHVLKE